MWDHGKNDSEYKPSSECHKDLTGRWVANDGAKYYLRQIGNYVWWIGSDKFNGEGFTNVFHGYRTDSNNKVLWGSWQDVPLGTASNKGFLTLYIANREPKYLHTVITVLLVGRNGQRTIIGILCVWEYYQGGRRVRAEDLSRCFHLPLLNKKNIEGNTNPMEDIQRTIKQELTPMACQII